MTTVIQATSSPAETRRDEGHAEHENPTSRRAVSVENECEVRTGGDRVDRHQRQANSRYGRNSRLQPAMNRCSVNCDAGRSVSMVIGSPSIGAGGPMRRDEHVDGAALDQEHEDRSAEQDHRERRDEADERERL